MYCQYEVKNYQHIALYGRDRTEYIICDNCKERISNIKCRICCKQAIYGWFDDDAKWYDAYCKDHEYIAKVKEDIADWLKPSKYACYDIKK